MKRLFTTERERELTAEYLSGGLTLVALAAREGCDQSTLQKIFKRHATPEQIKAVVSINYSKAKTGIARPREMVERVRAKLSKNQVQCICAVCGEEFGIARNRADDGKGKYCSKQCYNRWRETTQPVSAQCQECGTTFLAYQFALRNGQAKYCSKRCTDKAKERLRGPQTGNWKGGKTKEGNLVRGSAAYAQWRVAVFQRDGYTCQRCNRKGIYLEAHHIKSFNDHPELRFDVSNGMSVCLDCHSEIDPHRNRLAGPRRRKR